ncbi:MAG: hypothetical protein WBB29_13140 [Geitlerinemataceae cyanobacterium]
MTLSTRENFQRNDRLGGGFNRDRCLNSWRPSTYPDKGHNLATLFVTARHAIKDDL